MAQSASDRWVELPNRKAKAVAPKGCSAVGLSHALGQHQDPVLSSIDTNRSPISAGAGFPLCLSATPHAASGYHDGVARGGAGWLEMHLVGLARLCASSMFGSTLIKRNC